MSRVIDQMSRNTTNLPPGVSNGGGDGGQYDDPTVVAPADGDVRGDPRPLPNRGSRSGMVYGDDYGANLEAGFNALGSAHMPSDPPELCYPKGDSDFRFSASTHSSPVDGADHGIGAYSESDPSDMDAAQPQSYEQAMTTGPKGPMSNSGAGPRGASMAEGSPAEEASESPAEERDEQRRGQGDRY